MAKASSKKPRDTAPIDPMPARVDPCLATLVAKPPKEPVWAFEVMWDRYRRRYCEVPPFSRAEH